MIKTAFTLRNGEIDSCMSVEWPDHLTTASINTLAKIRGVHVGSMTKMLLSKEVLEFCNAYPALKLRARYNMLQGPYVVNSEKKLSDKELIKLAKQQPKRKPSKHTTGELPDA